MPLPANGSGPSGTLTPAELAATIAKAMGNGGVDTSGLSSGSRTPDVGDLPTLGTEISDAAVKTTDLLYTRVDETRLLKVIDGPIKSVANGLPTSLPSQDFVMLDLPGDYAKYNKLSFSQYADNIAVFRTFATWLVAIGFFFATIRLVHTTATS